MLSWVCDECKYFNLLYMERLVEVAVYGFGTRFAITVM